MSDMNKYRFAAFRYHRYFIHRGYDVELLEMRLKLKASKAHGFVPRKF